LERFAGVRSLKTAQTMRTVGFHNIYNIESELDAQHRRGTVNGWRL
jgi:hypothetical protein